MWGTGVSRVALVLRLIQWCFGYESKQQLTRLDSTVAVYSSLTLYQPAKRSMHSEAIIHVRILLSPAGDDMATSSNTYQPPPRDVHCSVVVEGVVYSWGGNSASDLQTIDVFNGEYRQVTTTGHGPVCVVYSCCAVVGKSIFHWEGEESGSSRLSSKDLYCITVGEWEWRKVQVTNPQDAPPPKLGSQMVALGDKLVVVGGRTADLKYTKDTHVFDIQRGEVTVVSTAITKDLHTTQFSATPFTVSGSL